jgi:hypothetical protein
LNNVLVSERAQKLRAALVKHRRMTTAWSSVRWAHQFELLAKFIPDPARIDRVLDWYCSHIGEQYVPVAYNAEEFRRKFIPIEDAARRAGATTDDGPQLSPAELRIFEQISSRLDLPPSALPDLPEFIVRSYQNAVEVYEKLHARGADPAIEYGGPVEFVVGWLRRLLERYESWAAWDGRLRGRYFRWDRPEASFLLNWIDLNYGQGKYHRAMTGTPDPPPPTGKPRVYPSGHRLAYLEDV